MIALDAGNTLGDNGGSSGGDKDSIGVEFRNQFWGGGSVAVDRNLIGLQLLRKIADKTCNLLFVGRA